MKKIFQILTLLVGLTVLAAESKAQTEVKEVHKTKKGWSNKAKGAAIGAGAGAITGAAVSNKKGKGAVIGGAVGAGAGYLVGRHKDKKNPNSRKTVYKTKTTVSNK
jgi:uncharacterized protein YcfJ